MKIFNWGAAYSNHLVVKKSAEIVDSWLLQGQAYKASQWEHGSFDIAYGEGLREVLDVYSPAGEVSGTLIFIHGGYWQAFSKNDHAQFAEGALARRWRVVILDYPLCPAASITHIVDCVRRGIEFTAKLWNEGPIVLAGHSAGGHLVTQVASSRGALTPECKARISRVVSMSGIHDLRPLLGASELNAVIGLDCQQARALSPVLDEPGHDFELICVCGSEELPEFRRQNTIFASLWLGMGITTESFEVRERHHFNLLDELKQSTSRLSEILTLARVRTR
ncbi:alpha/beta hydrolase [Pseudomonas synxantha]|nr:alpha/beta hydrolase [Pseudomonas synxantha]